MRAGEWKRGEWFPREEKMAYIKIKDRVENQPKKETKEDSINRLTELVKEYKEQSELVDIHTILANDAKAELLKLLK